MRDGDRALSEAVGRRVQLAAIMAGVATTKELAHLTGADERSCRRWLKGEVQPTLPTVIRLADVFEVSLDWLVWGRDDPPQGLLDWLVGPGKSAPEDARRYMITLPLSGYRAPVDFYQLVFAKWKSGVPVETPEEAVRRARKTLKLAPKQVPLP